ncbi:aspartyl-phosphate phosphatase Spo0E family protein [Metallumcola ferriviriculae]|uniref:Aspartyl-phosphate phosphatase Spo0E family protein n=1 Tax=Metallumcola ferriviriculae TaxID=3039180 RepID=A0AAU0URL4_9FIRM|nr:aspartyl-phosphate phosphatase Spo0E family protein [Desulfitibacteraceae bacterium MK1]
MNITQQVQQLRNRLNMLITEDKKPLSSEEVLALSQKLDRVVVEKMKAINEYEVNK